ncbi:OmpA family protein [Spiribacter vilamensis]|uniref:OmpA family protein n=1 Tax=Spiribacter vilamensis TaxID=531306 RepID=A0A4Q8CYR8_9GAMM|nr:OmpA family protein [Spiribacter vilamensis]RZU98138.1 OmpA family protein [Spiribacter vilamensis]TVO60961.1 OmpA family protein [Spiribacter vilamensis]
MDPKRYVGLTLLAVAIAAALTLDWIGRDHAPRTYTVGFERGTSLTAAGERTVERVAATMDRQSGYRASLVGHTGTRGEAEANYALGERRARTVRDALQASGIEPERITTHSVGGKEPLERQADETDRAYRDRLRRTEVRLQLQ